MKKFFSYAMLLAVAAMAFSSCAKEEIKGSDSNSVVLHFSAETSNTKSVFGAKSDGKYPTLWTDKKQVRFDANDSRKNDKNFTPKVVGSGESATFDVEFENLENTGTIYAFSPTGDFNATPKVPGFTNFTTDNNKHAIYLSIASEQTPLANSVDESAQVLFATAEYDLGVSKNISLEFNHLLAYGKMAITNFSGTIKSVKMEFPENINGQSVKFSYQETEPVFSSGLSNKTITLDPANVEGNVFWFSLAPTAGNSGEMKIIITDSNDDTYTKTLDLATKALPFVAGKVSAFSANFSGIAKDVPPVDYVTLPWNWEGGVKDDFLAIPGVSASGLGSDYKEGQAPYRIKMDDDNDYFVVKTNAAIGAISIGVKMIGGANASSLTVSGSADGKTYSDIQTLTISGKQNDTLNLSTSNPFDASFRYVKVTFTKGSNIGVGPISITSAGNAAVTGVALNKGHLDLYVGDFETLSATVSPNDAANKAVTWASSNTLVATVDENGKVTGAGVGTATITVTTVDGGFTATCNVEVSPVAIEGFEIKSSTSIKVGGTETLVPIFTPANATNKSVTWESSNNEVATVDDNGTVTGVAVGTATITATTLEGGHTAECEVTVVAGSNSTTVSIDFSGQGYANQKDMSAEAIYIDSNVSVTFDKGTNTSNVPKYYSSGTAVRVYGGNTFTVSAADSKITTITLTFGGSDGSNAITTDSDSGTFSSPTWDGSASSVTFKVGGSTGNRRIKAIEVTYE